MEELTLIGFAAIAVAIVIAILWILLPFAVFGTKPLLREILDEQQAMLAELKKLNTTLARGSADPAATEDSDG